MDARQKQLNKNRRHRRIRAKISGTAHRPRVSVAKSNTHIFVQAIDDVAGKTVVGVGDYKLKQGKRELKGKSGNAFAIGSQVGEELKKRGLKAAVFDKGGYKYHGRIKAVADGLRQAGIKI